MNKVLIILLVFSNFAYANHKKVTWEQLIPPDYDEKKEFEGIKWDTLQEDDEIMIAKIQSILDNAPADKKWNGVDVEMNGFVSPLEYDKNGIREFFFVPYFGACIHSPPPPANQIIFVKLNKPISVDDYYDNYVKIKGTLLVEESKKEIGVSGYSMKIDSINLIDY
ncbi:MAG: DUF3299 domain-containing protein [Rickettsiales bacterium]|jgi:hypothetical protein|nr:DUF3299 domain-containing protein [Rickettsiales bacterium]